MHALINIIVQNALILSMLIQLMSVAAMMANMRHRLNAWIALKDAPNAITKIFVQNAQINMTSKTTFVRKVESIHLLLYLLLWELLYSLVPVTLFLYLVFVIIKCIKKRRTPLSQDDYEEL